MAKNKNLLLYLLFLAGSISATCKVNTVAEIYTSQLGVRELSGRNDGKQVEMYLKSANLSKGQPWCAAFITWTFKEAGVKAVVSGYSPSWFPNKNVVYIKGGDNNKSPQQSDVFGIYFPSKKRIAHVGFIDQWSEGNFTITVEGNTNEAGSREGDGVYRKRRLKNQIYKISRWI